MMVKESNSSRRIFLFGLILFIVLLPVPIIRAHGYIFKYAREEMQNDIQIEIKQNQILINYKSLYMGQIAPHIRLMIDKNKDSLISEKEVKIFFDEFQNRVNKQLTQLPVRIDGQKFLLKMIHTISPTILKDSLLAPLGLIMKFQLQNEVIADGLHQIEFDPRLFFLPGNEIVRLAKERVAFTRNQEQSIARYVQIRVSGDSNIRFLNTYPGRLKNAGKMVYIFGVFFDKTVLEIETGKYPNFRIQFRTGVIE